MNRYREIYRAEQLPVFQNRMFHSEQEARNCIKGDVVLVQDIETGLIFNQAFRPDLMQLPERNSGTHSASIQLSISGA
jgi:hypothetical protein